MDFPADVRSLLCALFPRSYRSRVKCSDLCRGENISFQTLCGPNGSSRANCRPFRILWYKQHLDKLCHALLDRRSTNGPGWGCVWRSRLDGRDRCRCDFADVAVAGKSELTHYCRWGGLAPLGDV